MWLIYQKPLSTHLSLGLSVAKSERWNWDAILTDKMPIVTYFFPGNVLPFLSYPMQLLLPRPYSPVAQNCQPVASCLCPPWWHIDPSAEEWFFYRSSARCDRREGRKGWTTVIADHHYRHLSSAPWMAVMDKSAEEGIFYPPATASVSHNFSSRLFNSPVTCHKRHVYDVLCSLPSSGRYEL